MAFSYKNPLEVAINKLPSKQSDQLFSLAADQIEKKMETLNSLFSFFVTPEVQEMLINAGVALSPLSFEVHSHPACKMIENHIMYIVLPSLLKEYRSVAFFSLRPSKVQRFLKMYQAMNHGKIKSMGMYNAIIDGKDAYRYGETTFSEFRDRVDALRKECLEKNKFPSVLILHDELHFLEPLDIAYLFEQIPEINRVVATTVFPIEILLGDDHSKDPRIYKIKCKRHQNRFFYYPDGVASEGYEQKISTSSWPFKHNCIRWFGKSIRVSKQYSLFSHHVFTFDNGRSCNNVLMFNKPSCLLNSELKILTSKFDQAIIERKTIASICTYLSCLKSPNAASAVAKLRQLEKRELYPDELSLVYSFGNEMAKYGLRDEIEQGVLSWVKDKLVNVLPDFIKCSFFAERTFHQNVRLLNQTVSEAGICLSRTPLRLDEVRFWEDKNDRLKGLAELLGIEILKISEPVDGSYSLRTNDEDENYELGEPLLDWEKVVCRLSHPMFYKINSRQLNVKKNFLLSAIRGMRMTWQPQLCGKALTELEEVAQCSTSCSNDDQSDRVNFMGSPPLDVIEVFNSAHNLRSRVHNNKRKNDCVFKAIASHLGVSSSELIQEISDDDISDELMDCIDMDKGLSHDLITEILIIKGLSMYCTRDFKDLFVLNRNFGPNGKIYCTIKDNHCELSDQQTFNKLMKNSMDVAPSGSHSGSMDHLFDMGIHVNSHEDTLKLAKSFCRGTTGLLKEIEPGLCKNLLECAELVKQPFSCKVGLRLGFAGSGKSLQVIKWAHFTSVVKRCFISPRRALADDLREKLKGTNCAIMTFETALKRIDRSYHEIILDEISLYPPGYIGLLHLAANRRMIKGISEGARIESWRQISGNLQKIYCIGDPLQVRYFSAEDSLLLGKSSDLDYMIKAIKYKYLWQAYRFGEWFKDIVEINVKNDGTKHKNKFHPDISTIKDKNLFDAILCPNQEAKKNFQVGLPVYTYGESQGLTFNKKTLIVLNENTFKGSTNQIIVAITRSRTGFEFVLNGITLHEAAKYSEKGILGLILTGKKVPTERFMSMLGSCSLYTIDMDIGNDSNTSEGGSIQDKASFDPFIMPFINLAEEENDPEEITGEVVEAPEWFKCHVPIFDCDPMLVEIFEKVEAKEKREFQSMLGFSNQFLDIEKGGSKIDVFPMAKQSIFPHHQASDDVTFWAGVKKRIKLSNWKTEWAKLEEAMSYGDELRKVFTDMLPCEFSVKASDIDFGEKSFIDKRKQKTAKMWENHKERSDIDWNLDHVFLFMKSQFCTKEAKMFTEAKAGQTLACFQHIVLFRFGPMLRAIERAFLRACGENYYIHSGKNFMCLDAFVTGNASSFQGESVESDYTAFDSSQDHVILAFEVSLLRYLGVSEQFVRDYMKIKLTLGSRIGNLAIMRFTGEFCTFLFNTFANMLFTALKYDLNKRKDRILFAGDDMCSIGCLRKTNDNRKITLLSKFSLTAVEETRKYPMFCGWYLTPYGILKSPKLLWARIIMMVERNLIELCIDNYLFEAIFAYRLGERLYEVLKQEDFEYHYLVTRFFVKKSRLLKGASRSLILEIGEGIGSCLSSTSADSCLQLSLPNSKLTQLSPMNCTKMRHFCIHKCLTVSRDLNPMLKYVQRKVVDSFWLTFNFLISKSSVTLLGGQISTSTYILGLCLSGSKRSCQTLKEWAGELFYMMANVLKKDMHTLLRLSSSLGLQTRVILQFVQDTVYQRLQRSLEIDSGSGLTLIARDTMLTMNFLPWTLGLPTDVSIPLGFLTRALAQMAGWLRQYQVVNCLSTTKTLEKQYGASQSHLKLKKLKTKFISPREVDSCLTKLQGLEGLKQASQSQKRKDLGPFLLELKDLAKMSLEAVVVESRRTRVGRYIWTTYLEEKIARATKGQEPPRDKGVVDEEEDPDEDEETKSTRQLSTEHFIKYLFGNIAIYGSSSKTEFPNVAFDLPPIVLKIKEQAQAGAKAGETSTPAAETEKIVMIELKMNLFEIVPEIKSFCKNSTYNTLSEATFRQICEAFATPTMEFLREKWSSGLSTNIYKKWPKAMENAPWTAFDFASGLNMKSLTPEEKLVIDRMTKRLFRTEGQKGIFKAGAEIDTGLEG